MVGGLIQNSVDYAQASVMLECCENTVRKLCQTGELACARHGKKMRIFIDSIEAYNQRMHERALKDAERKRKAHIG